MSPSDTRCLLIADRDPAIRSLLEAVVRHMGFRPVAAPDLGRVLPLVDTEDVAAAIVDPADDAHGVISRLTVAKPELAGRIIVITTLPRETAEKCAGVASVIRKPFHLDVLQQAIMACCGR